MVSTETMPNTLYKINILSKVVGIYIIVTFVLLRETTPTRNPFKRNIYVSQQKLGCVEYPTLFQEK